MVRSGRGDKEGRGKRGWRQKEVGEGDNLHKRGAENKHRREKGRAHRKKLKSAECRIQYEIIKYNLFVYFQYG